MQIVLKLENEDFAVSTVLTNLPPTHCILLVFIPSFLAEKLNGSSIVDVPTLQRENFDLKARVKELEEINKELQARVSICR